MKNMKTLVLSLIWPTLFSLPINANELIELETRKVQVPSQNLTEIIVAIMQNPETVLQRYRPEGITVKNKKISGNQIEFMATKSVLGISRTVLYKGILEIEELTKQNNYPCFKATQDFQGSGELIIENIEKMELTFCLQELKNNQTNAIIKPVLTKGRNPGGMLGNVATNLIIDQVDPVILAIKEEILAKQSK